MFFNVSATVLTGGIAGLELLKSTRDRQEELVRDNALVKRETEYFQQNIGNISSAEELVDDPRLLRVALEAYGLGEEFPKKAYIQNILESDLNDPASAANRVSDPRWTAFAEAFIKTEISVPGPLSEGFGARMSQRAFAVELSKYTTQTTIDDITKDAEAFRTAMAGITTPQQLVNNREALAFVKDAFGITDSTSTNDEIIGYLSAFNEFKLNDDGSAVVPDEWKDARSTLSFFNETYIVGSTDTTDTKANDVDTIEEVVLQRFRQELAEETGHFAYTKRQDDFVNAVRTYDNVDDFLADTASLTFMKEAFNLASDTTDTATIKDYLTRTYADDIPSKWQPVRNLLGFHTATLTASTEDMTDFKANMATYTSLDDFLNDADALNKVKTAYGLENNTTDDATLRTYLLATDDSTVPDAFKDMREVLGYYTTDGTAPDTVDIDAISDLYLAVTGTRNPLDAPVADFLTLSEVADQHKELNVRYVDDISKFDRFKAEADNFELTIGLAASDADIVANGRSLRFAMAAFGLENESFDSFKAFEVLTGERTLGQSATDAKWRDFRNNFSFAAAENNLKTQEEGFSTEIIEDFVDNTFIEAVGEQDPDLRLALYFENRIAEIAATNNIDAFGWLQISGEPPMARVFQTAFNLPESFGQLDVDKQQDIYRLRSQSVVGTSRLSDFQDSTFVNQIVETFLLRASIAATSGNSNVTALL